MLTERRAEILNLVIDEYIDTAVPVSSRALVDRHQLGFSSATVRNELAHLEDEGYITHPYTSAGRVPSDSGYRVYVERLMSEEPLGSDEQRTIEHQFHQVAAGPDEWLRLAATILASAVDNVAVITRPTRRVVHLRHLQLVELNAGSMLLVAVLDDGRVRERIVATSEVAPDGAKQRTLSRLAERVNERVGGLDAEAARTIADEWGDVPEGMLARHAAMLLEEAVFDVEIYVEGVRPALAQPEFASPDRMLDAVAHLESYQMQQLLPHLAPRRDGEMRVMIGPENPEQWLHDWSIVVSTFGDASGAAGTIAVLGPMRMRYGRTIPRVRYVSTLMSHLLEEVG